ncbi:hypothetical protein CLAFUW4_09749 [Fulvia fulva]|uniref:Uncharacterized protein n=1 Tax=Passalora fulva TaxID=5499 RepID=A0A9Q8UUE3_PASFU|nr:uncharacterized protein CLAFUR5_12489 [Fulvia fulva]KAK4616303.1 hypothetical protein CLAFUR4_09754 [Fulvia fulva]KAK4617017.1 hypothetical protein CLAFUR0_09746 [Fulvia fulva]UJO22808.1 hypothetical protein CLAFUR5_12489 [Fulvia fulva]WPV19712.1 hypothetical protein CLAFUW4_09749 [Fulvia fulva]WPV34208.1 hypothetical protein CLAFUW7_09751 [Fulvia fulva]
MLLALEDPTQAYTSTRTMQGGRYHPLNKKQHLADGFVVGSPPRSPPRGKLRDNASNSGHHSANSHAWTSLTERDHGRSVTQVRNHRRSSAVGIEVDEHLRRRSLPKDSAQSESALFQGRLEAFLETCVELVVHDQIAKVVTKHVKTSLNSHVAQKETCCDDLAHLEEDLETLKVCQRDLEMEKARVFQRATGGSISDLADVDERQGYCPASPSAQLRKDSTQHDRFDNYQAAQDCPVQCAAVLVVSALSSVFYQRPSSAFDGPPASPLDDIPVDRYRFTDGSSSGHGGIGSSDDITRKSELMRRPLGEHLFLPGVQIDKNATIEQALADARFMNQLLPSHAMEEQHDSAHIIDRLLRLIAEVEVDIRALRRKSKLELSDLEHKILRASAYQSGKLIESLTSFDSKLRERQNAAWCGLIETASTEAGCNPTAALQSTLCPAGVRRAASAAQPVRFRKDHHTRPRRSKPDRQHSDSAMAVCGLESMSL